MSQQHGRRYEHDLVGDLDDRVSDETWVTSAGYSGNAAYDHCDIAVAVDPTLRTAHEPLLYCIEAKKRQGDGGKRVSDVFAGGGDDETGLDELRRLVDSTPEWGCPLLAIKFDHRKLVVLDARDLRRYLDGTEVLATPTGIYETLDPRVTPSENVSMVKPPLESWDSAQVGPPDAVVLATAMGVPVNGGEQS